MAEENKPKKEKRDWSSEGELPYDKIPVFKQPTIVTRNVSSAFVMSRLMPNRRQGR